MLFSLLYLIISVYFASVSSEVVTINLEDCVARDCLIPFNYEDDTINIAGIDPSVNAMAYNFNKFLTESNASQSYYYIRKTFSPLQYAFSDALFYFENIDGKSLSTESLLIGSGNTSVTAHENLMSRASSKSRTMKVLRFILDPLSTFYYGSRAITSLPAFMLSSLGDMFSMHELIDSTLMSIDDKFGTFIFNSYIKTRGSVSNLRHDYDAKLAVQSKNRPYANYEQTVYASTFLAVAPESDSLLGPSRSDIPVRIRVHVRQLALKYPFMLLVGIILSLQANVIVENTGVLFLSAAGLSMLLSFFIFLLLVIRHRNNKAVLATAGTSLVASLLTLLPGGFSSVATAVGLPPGFAIFLLFCLLIFVLAIVAFIFMRLEAKDRKIASGILAVGIRLIGILFISWSIAHPMLRYTILIITHAHLMIIPPILSAERLIINFIVGFIRFFTCGFVKLQPFYPMATLLYVLFGYTGDRSLPGLLPTDISVDQWMSNASTSTLEGSEESSTHGVKLHGGVEAVSSPRGFGILSPEPSSTLRRRQMQTPAEWKFRRDAVPAADTSSSKEKEKEVPRSSTRKPVVVEHVHSNGKYSSYIRNLQKGKAGLPVGGEEDIGRLSFGSKAGIGAGASGKKRRGSVSRVVYYYSDDEDTADEVNMDEFGLLPKESGSPDERTFEEDRSDDDSRAFDSGNDEEMEVEEDVSPSVSDIVDELRTRGRVVRSSVRRRAASSGRR